MNKLIIASTAAALMVGVSGSAFAAMSAADCQSLFQRADINKDGSLQADEAKVFLDAMNQAQVKPKDVSMVTKDEFTMACEKDAFANIDPATIGTAASTTATTDQGTTTEQPAATAEQSTTATTEQPAATAEQSTTATTEQPAATAEQSTTATTEQPATTEPTTDETASTTQPTTTEQPATTSGEQALAAPSGLLASNLIGTTVYSADDQSIGDINDIILPPEGGQPMQVIVGVGGFLGLGEKDVVLDMSKLSFVTTDDGNLKVVAQTSQEELKNMPAFTKQPAQQ